MNATRQAALIRHLDAARGFACAWCNGGGRVRRRFDSDNVWCVRKAWAADAEMRRHGAPSPCASVLRRHAADQSHAVQDARLARGPVCRECSCMIA